MYPIPVSIIQASGYAAQGITVRNIAISDLNSVTFFFLLWLGKYCKGSTETVQNPFRINDVQLFIGHQPHNSATASNAVLAQADFVSLLFTTQKNGVKGGSIGNGRIDHTQGCPVASTRIQLEYLQLHGATGKTPISSYKKGTK